MLASSPSAAVANRSASPTSPHATTGAFLAAGCQHAARRLRNRILVARGEPAVKDVVWRPPWAPLGAVGAVAGAIASAITGSPLVGAAAATALPALLASSSVATLLQARRR